MSIIGFLRRHYLNWAVPRYQKRLLQQPGPDSLERSRWEQSLKDPTAFYLDCFRYFCLRLPPLIREHRAYFKSEGRGFGEDALHTLWFLLFQEFKPATFLEIGVFRGQTLSLAALLSRYNKTECKITGISPFSSAGDRVSKYATQVDYLSDTLLNFEHFQLPKPELIKAYSTDPEAVRRIRETSWDMIYIDGSHDYEVVCKDWDVCSESLKVGGVVVLDDSGLSSPYTPPMFATGGHPGPSQKASELDRTRFQEILQVGHNRVFLKLR
jgi:Methyltransferase domain